MTEAVDIELAGGVSARDRRAIISMRAQQPAWGIAAYLDRPIVEVEAVIRAFDAGALPCPSDDDVLFEEARATPRRKRG